MFLRAAAYRLCAAIALTCSITQAGAADANHPTARFQVTGSTAIPGATLSPGTYTLSVVDHLSDRYILRVDGTADHTLFIGLPSKSLAGNKPGEQTWSTPADGTTYIRGWNFSSLATPLEFVYPKNDAVAIAKANDAHVPAIDPESDGMLQSAQLSKDQMHIITLWLLSPTQVGPDAPAGIAAKRLTLLASARKPVVARLPHTASPLPLVWLTGLLALAMACGLRLTRGWRPSTEVN